MASELTGATSDQRPRHRPAVRGRTRRATVTVALAVAAALVFPVSAAHAEPDREAERKKLEQLNKSVEKKVQKYNAANEKYKVAKRKYKATNKAAEAEQKTFDKLRGELAQMAANAYKRGDTADVTGFVAANDPQAVLDQAAVFQHLARNRSSELGRFLASAQRVRREKAQAKAAFDEAAAKRKDLKKQKEDVEKSIAKQKRKLAALGEPVSSGGGSVGGTYNGPASGSARKALDYAYAQLGKPYVYGGEGPNGFDCSGLTMRSWGSAGVNLPRTTYSQYSATRRVSKSNLQPGDLVFFNGLGHMGMYVGGGKMIHAPRTGKTVEVVPITSGYYLSNYYGAGRP